METLGNVTEIYNRKAREYYLKALLNILGGEEECCSYNLNAARNSLLGSRHFTDFSDADVKHILPHLTVETFYKLYGDHGSKSETRWIRDPELVAMVIEDIQHLSPLFRADQDQIARQQADADGPAVRLAS